jgi:mitotic spindle assembly checkpoint protein MAD1
LRLKENPINEAIKSKKEELILLREENKSLLNQKSDVPKETVDRLTVQEKELKKQLLDLEARNTRLKQVFKEKIMEFRQTVYVLFGYQLEITENNTTRVLSMYAFNEGDYMIFQRQKDGSLTFMESEYTKQWTKEIEFYVKQRRSIPMFLSAVTQSLFERSTFM